MFSLFFPDLDDEDEENEKDKDGIDIISDMRLKPDISFFETFMGVVSIFIAIAWYISYFSIYVMEEANKVYPASKISYIILIAGLLSCFMGIRSKPGKVAFVMIIISCIITAIGGIAAMKIGGYI